MSIFNKYYYEPINKKYKKQPESFKLLVTLDDIYNLYENHCIDEDLKIISKKL